MQRKPFWLHEFYCWFYIFSIFRQTFSFFWPESPSYLYHYILRHYDPVFRVTYYMDIIHLALDWSACLAVYAYVYRKNFLDEEFWKILLGLRILFSLKNYSFFQQQLTSIYIDSPKLCAGIIIGQILLVTPSYLVMWRYATSKKIS